MTEDTIREMRRKLDEQYKKDRETIDRMEEFLIRNKKASLSAQVPSIPEPALTIVDRIFQFIEKMDGNFTMKQLMKFIADEDANFSKDLSYQSIPTALWKLTKSEKIKILIPRKGKSGAVYCRA